MPLPQERADARTISTAGDGRVAVIDIGSNSIRLVVYDHLGRAPVPLFNEKILCGLGRTVGKTGRLSPEGVALALENLRRFTRLIQAMEVGRVHVLATAAVRDAADGAEFVAEAGRLTGLTIRVIAGQEEARLSALGVLSGTPGADGLMGDLGGGSLELVNLEKGVPGQQVTLPLGPFRLMDGNGRGNAVIRAIDEHLEGLPWLSQMAGRPFYPVGGNWRAIARLHMEQTGYPVHIIHNYAVVADVMQGFASELARPAKPGEKPLNVARRRSDTLPWAALVMERVIRAAKPGRVVFTAYGLREGLLYDLLPPDQQAQDPLLAHCADVEHRLGRFGHGDIIALWTTGLFPGEDAASLRLRQAACLLSDLGWSEHPDYRAQHAFMRILRMPFAGIDHGERAFLALTAYGRYEGRIDSPLLNDDRRLGLARRLLNDSQLRRAQVLGLALRLAHSLTGGVSELLQRTQLRLEAEKLVLALPDDARVLVGDVVGRRLDALAKLLNRTGEITGL